MQAFFLESEFSMHLSVNLTVKIFSFFTIINCFIANPFIMTCSFIINSNIPPYIPCSSTSIASVIGCINPEWRTEIHPCIITIDASIMRIANFLCNSWWSGINCKIFLYLTCIIAKAIPYSDNNFMEASFLQM